MLKRNPPRLVILDRMMPDIDGPQVLSFIRSNPQLKNTAVIDYSAASKNSDADETIRKGVQAQVAKGSPWEELLDQIYRLAPKS